MARLTKTQNKHIFYSAKYMLMRDGDKYIMRQNVALILKLRKARVIYASEPNCNLFCNRSIQTYTLGESHWAKRR